MIPSKAYKKSFETCTKNPRALDLNEIKYLDVLILYTVGGVSAAVSKTAAAPIERVKLLIQNQVGADFICSIKYTLRMATLSNVLSLLSTQRRLSLSIMNIPYLHLHVHSENSSGPGPSVRHCILASGF